MTGRNERRPGSANDGNVGALMKILREDSEFTPRKRGAAMQGARNAMEPVRQHQ